MRSCTCRSIGGRPAPSGNPMNMSTGRSSWRPSAGSTRRGATRQSHEHSRGAIVLAVGGRLVRTFPNEFADGPTAPSPLLGSLIFGFGLLMYVVGRVFSISIFEMGSQILVISGGLLLLKGP